MSNRNEVAQDGRILPASDGPFASSGGRFVVMPNDPRRFGKLIEIDAHNTKVEIFRSVSDREHIAIPLSQVFGLELPRETRVFVEVANQFWRVGRVLGSERRADGSFIYEVRFPNGQQADLSEADLHVRCLDAFADPAEILTAGCAETQFFADRRRRALRRLRALRSATQGLTGLVSASIEIVPHQAAAARRVLQDSVQRYLLADEVGLGKTIEAGIVIRQTLIDDPARKVLVLVPAALVEQWHAELDRRFGISDFPDAVTVRSHDDLDRLSAESVPDLLVVDEAHNVVPAAGSEDASTGATRIIEIARRATRILLLSATPALGDEDRLLGLLNLLDPANYPLADRGGFRRKVADRQAIGRILLPLHRRSPPFVLRSQAQQAARTFPADLVVQTEAARILAAGSDRAELDAAVESLREYVIRTYRLHDRLIRTRRTDASLWFRARGPEWPRLDHVRLEFAEEAGADGIGALLEGWRLDALAVPQPDGPALADRLIQLVQAAWHGPSALLAAIGIMAPLFPGETDHLNALSAWALDPAHTEARLAAITQALLDLRRAGMGQRTGLVPKIVCFVSDRSEAERATAHLRRRLGPFEVAAVLQTGVDAAAAAVDSFRSDPEAWVLVCDRSGEEGLNLQFAHGILHVDLPFSAGRVEQRIGRLDRYGRRVGVILHRVLLPDDDEEALWRGWFDLLVNGFRLFSRSISDVQFRLEAIDRRVSDLLLTKGGLAVSELADEIDTELAAERTKLDEQHALDNLALLSDDASPLVDTIEASEEDEQAIADDLRPWITEVLRLRQQPHRAEAGDTLRFFWDSDTLLPKIPWRATLDVALDRLSTWSRTRAQSPNGPSPALLRPGSPLFDALERVARWDDRGIAYATWRVEPGWPEVFRGFRLVWVVEPSVSIAGPVWGRDSAAETLRRRAEALLPVATYEQFLDDSGEQVTDPSLLRVLFRDYREGLGDGARDINLGSRPKAMEQAIDAGLLREIVARVRAAGEARLRADDLFVNRRSEAQTNLGRESLRARRSLEQRNMFHRAEFGSDLPDFRQELTALDLLGAAIENPLVRLDEFGLVVVSGEPPIA